MDNLKANLKSGAVTFGAWVTVGHPEISELMANLGFDWIVYDMEHSPLTIETVECLLQATNGTEPGSVVRVPWNDPVLIKQVLDIGPDGILVPMVNSKAEAVQAVRATRYPPDGIRGVGPKRASVYGLNPQYRFTKAKELFVAVQVETRKAVDNIHDIVSAEGVDCVFIGPDDLSTSLGYPGNPKNPVVQQAMDRVLEAGKAAAVPVGLYPIDMEDLKRSVTKGYKFITVGADLDFLMYGSSRFLEAVGRKPKIYTST